MEKALPIAIASFKRAVANGKVKFVFGAGAVAGSIGRNEEEYIYRPLKMARPKTHRGHHICDVDGGRVAQHEG
jgi:hypothetical protein